jgi:GntR family transcriptional regulator, transcriptional repressor for pyruvate dehydrogenase complex
MFPAHDAASGGGVSLAPDTASENAARHLRALIFSSELGPGDRLPSERGLATQLGISRMTLRLALKSLESDGLIITSRGAHGGSRVADLESLLRCWQVWTDDHEDDLDDIFEMRLTMETRISALAAERRTTEDLETIQAAVESESNGPSPSSLFRTDMDVHRAIARAAHSPRLLQSMLDVRGELFLPVDQALLEHRTGEVHESHRAIFEAIRDRDADRAAELTRVHIEQVRTLVRRALSRRPG